MKYPDEDWKLLNPCPSENFRAHDFEVSALERTRSMGMLKHELQASVEEKLSQLALWVIEAERARRPYGLGLPHTQIPPTLGQSHFHQCLRALSLFRSAKQEREHE